MTALYWIIGLSLYTAIVLIIAKACGFNDK